MIEVKFHVSEVVVSVIGENPKPMVIRKVCGLKRAKKFKGFVLCEWWDGRKWHKQKFHQGILRRLNDGFS